MNWVTDNSFKLQMDRRTDVRMDGRLDGQAGGHDRYTNIYIRMYICRFFPLKLGKWWNVCPTDSHRQTDGPNPSCGYSIRLCTRCPILGWLFWGLWMCLYWRQYSFDQLLDLPFSEHSFGSLLRRGFCVPFTRSSETNQTLLGLSGFLAFRSRVKLNFILTVNYDKWTRWLFIYVKFAFLLLLLVFEKFKTPFQKENSLERLFRKSTNDFVV